MILYSYWRSSCTWRVRIALAYKGLPHEIRTLDLHAGEQRAEGHRAKNPMAQVPVLEWDEGGATRRLGQSMAILEWLEERHPEPALLPADPFLRARARQLAEMVNAGIQPLQNVGVTQELERLGLDARAFARDAIARGLAAVERSAAEVAGRFAVGNAPTFADLCIVPQLYNARRFDLDPASFPTLARIESACESLEAFQAAHPDRQPDAPRS